MRMIVLCMLCCGMFASERVYRLEDKKPVSASPLSGYIQLHVDHPEIEHVHLPGQRIRSIRIDRLGHTRLRMSRIADDDILIYHLKRNIFEDKTLLNVVNTALGDVRYRVQSDIERQPINGPYFVALSPLRGFLHIRKSSYPEADIHLAATAVERVAVDRFGHTTLRLRKELGRSVVSYTLRENVQSSAELFTLLAAARKAKADP